MAALQPAMFPEIEGPDFVRRTEVDDVAAKVLDRHGSTLAYLRPVAEAIEADELHVLYLANTKPLSPDDELTHETAGKCIKAPRVWHDVTGFDIVIWVRSAFWDQADDNYREGLVLHELLHVEARRDKNEQLRVAIRKHDVEDFVDVARHYGPIGGDGGRYVRAAQLHDSPIRAVDDDRIGKLVCQGSNHVPGHTEGCPQFDTASA